MTLRAIVCGGRHYSRKQELFDALDFLHEMQPISEVIHGAALGADSLSGEWAKARKVRETPVPADWERYGRAAGMWRNMAMLDLKPDLVIAFPGGKGTQNMIDLAESADVRVMRAGGAA